MRILVISHMYPSSLNRISGIFVHEQIKELRKQGCETKVISPVPWTPFPLNQMRRKWKAYSEIPKRMNLEGVEVYYPRYLEFPKGLFFASLGNRIYQGVRAAVHEIYQDFPFDLIHAHVALPDGQAATLICRELGKPLVVTVHGQDLQRTIFRNARCFEATKKVFISTNQVIVVSNKLKRISEEHFGKRDNLTVINDGVRTANILRRNNLLAQKYKDKRVILSVSNLVKAKGIDLNLKAIKQLINKYPDLHYIVIGDGIERKELERLSSDLDVIQHMEFLGQLPNNEAREYMSVCNVFSLPSWNEGFGVVYLEAMTKSKPVIACRGQGIADVIKDGETGLLVKPRDEDSLIKAIDFLLSHQEKAKKIGERGRKLVLENFTLEKNAKRTIEVYKEVLGEREN